MMGMCSMMMVEILTEKSEQVEQVEPKDEKPVEMECTEEFMDFQYLA